MEKEYHRYLCWLGQIRGLGRKGIFALLRAAGEENLFSGLVPDPLLRTRTFASSPYFSEQTSVSDSHGIEQDSGVVSHDPQQVPVSGSRMRETEAEEGITPVCGKSGPRMREDGSGVREADLNYAARTLYNASEEHIVYFCGEAFSSPTRQKNAVDLLLSARKLEPERIEEELQRAGIAFSCILEEEFPEKLREIPDPPFGLYYKGKLPNGNEPAAAIIGARMASGYGREQARRFARRIAARGISVISGMARGVDGIAQKAALEAGGKSYAVLGCGVDICYPEENRELYEMLLQKGGVLSEYSPGTFPEARLFPPRNRLISGLSDMVLVIEARRKSGTQITVDMALEQGRDVYALPGRVTDSLSDGCNRLIRQGAGPATSPEDILEYFFGTGQGDKDRENIRMENQEKQKVISVTGKRESEDQAAEETCSGTGGKRCVKGTPQGADGISLEACILRILSAEDEMHIEQILEEAGELYRDDSAEVLQLSVLLPALLRLKIEGKVEERISGYYRKRISS